MKVAFKNVIVQVAGRRIIDDVSFEVPSGSVVGLLGPNGCGKSTLLRTIYRAQRPSTGSVLVGGQDVTTLKSSQVARRVAVMAQESAYDFPVRARELAMLGRAPHQRGFGADSATDHELVGTALRQVGALHFAERYVSELSGGEKQRVQLARALVQQTPILILDEPTNHLDISFQLELMSLATSRGLTVLIALHDMNLATEFCDYVALLKSGSLQDFGHPDQVLTQEAIRDGFGVDSQRLAHPLTGNSLIAISKAQSSHHGPSWATTSITD